MEITAEIKDLALKIDQSCDAKNAVELQDLIKDCEYLLLNAKEHHRVDINYFIANSYSCLWRIKSETEGPWQWAENETVQEVLALRRAISEPAFEKSNAVRRCQIRTNLANSLNGLGRTVEAIEEYSKALSLNTSFAMALGNRAYAISVYSWYLYDSEHQNLLLNCAMRDYGKSLQSTAFWDSGFESRVADQFAKKMSEISAYLNNVRLDEKSDSPLPKLKNSPKENEYRRWCLENCLFLNPLNDVMEEDTAARDIFHLPSHTYGIDEDIRFPSFYNILKQEYVSARYHYFTSHKQDEDHFSDREVLLFDSFDFGQFDIRTEQLKISFRSAYSILDKVSLFINDYFGIGLAVENVSFRKIWESKVKGGKIELRAPFVGSQNLPLRGLYFLAKDFFDSEFKEFASPDAKDLATLRNFSEHRFVTLTDFGPPKADDERHIHIPREEFSKKTMRLIKMVRASLIYLSMAIYREEEIRKSAQKGESLRLSVPVTPVIRQRPIN